MSAVILAIDPGMTGALAAIDDAGAVVAVADLPIIRDGKLAWIDAPTFLSQLLALTDGQTATAVVERQQAMPRQGVSSTFKIGTGFGSLLATLQVARLPIELVTAAKWKRAVGLLGSDKHASLDKARLLFPTAPLDRVKDHGRAEALLLGYWWLHRRDVTRASGQHSMAI